MKFGQENGGHYNEATVRVLINELRARVSELAARVEILERESMMHRRLGPQAKTTEMSQEAIEQLEKIVNAAKEKINALQERT